MNSKLFPNYSSLKLSWIKIFMDFMTFCGIHESFVFKIYCIACLFPEVQVSLLLNFTFIPNLKISDHSTQNLMLDTEFLTLIWDSTIIACANHSYMSSIMNSYMKFNKLMMERA